MSSLKRPERRRPPAGIDALAGVARPAHDALGRLLPAAEAAASEREKISFRQLNKKTGHRIRYRKVDPESGHEVESSDIIKGYEVAEGEYIELDLEELEDVALESKRMIEIDEFVPKSQIDELYIRDPYYIAPDGEVNQQAFAVIREAIRREGMVAIGKVVFTSCEHIIALEARQRNDGYHVALSIRGPKGEGLLRGYLRREGPKGYARLALHIVETKRGDFGPKSSRISTRMP